MKTNKKKKKYLFIFNFGTLFHSSMLRELYIYIVLCTDSTRQIIERNIKKKKGRERKL